MPWCFHSVRASYIYGVAHICIFLYICFSCSKYMRKGWHGYGECICVEERVVWRCGTIYKRTRRCRRDAFTESPKRYLHFFRRSENLVVYPFGIYIRIYITVYTHIREWMFRTKLTLYSGYSLRDAL